MKRELVFGNGLLGEAYRAHASASGHDVHQTSRRPNSDNPNEHFLDLSEDDSADKVAQLFEDIKPDVVINAAAKLGRNPEDNLEQNSLFTRNILEGAKASGFDFFRIVVIGSSAEYGPLEPSQLPVGEKAQLNPDSAYGQSKLAETELALKLADEYELPIVVARLFNLLGSGLHPSNLVSGVINQLKEHESKGLAQIEVRNLDPMRDYQPVDETVRVIEQLAHAEKLDHRVYNVGSGESISNEDMIRKILSYTNYPDMSIVGTNSTPEKIVGSAHADVTRFREEFPDYRQQYTTDDAIEKIVKEAGLWHDLRKAA